MIMAELPLIAMVKIPLAGLTIAEQMTERHLDTWCAWKHGWSGPRGYPGEALVGENYTTLDHNSERAYEKLDGWVAMQVELVIDGIGQRNPAQKAALYRAYDVVAAFQFPRGNYAELLKAAKVEVMAGLKRRSVWLGE